MKVERNAGKLYQRIYDRELSALCIIINEPLNEIVKEIHAATMLIRFQGEFDLA